MLDIITSSLSGLIAPQMVNGWHNHSEEILLGLDEARRSRPYKNMSLGEYLCYFAHEKLDKKLDLSKENRKDLVGEFYRDIGILNPGEVTVKNLTSTYHKGSRFLFPELVRSAVEQGLADAIYPNIVAETQKVSGERTAVMPTLILNNNIPEAVGEGETMPQATVTYTSRSIELYPKALGIKFTYDALNGMKMNLLQKFLGNQGMLMGLTLDADALNVLLSGDQGNGSQSPAIVGISSTTSGLQYEDFIRIFTWIAGRGFIADTIIVSFEEAIKVFNMDEFKLRDQNGTVLIESMSNIPLPQNINIWAKSNMPSEKIIVMDSNNALVEFDAEPLLIETDKMIFERIEGTTTSMRVGFGNLHRTARVVIDLSQEYGTAGYGFDDYPWFAPLDNIPLSSV